MALIRCGFFSEIIGYQTNINVILPFEKCRFLDGTPNVKKRFPVLYLLHGGGGNQDDWIRYSSIERYAERYKIAVVMPDVSGNSFYADMAHGYPYFTYLTEELPGLVESYFPIGGCREKRFVAGLSMGGYGSLKWGLCRPEFFGYAASFSGASLIMEMLEERDPKLEWGDDENNVVVRNWGSLEALAGSQSDTAFLLERAASMKERLPKLYVAIGTEDFSYKYTKRFMDYARKLGLDIYYEEGPGEHDWDFWDPCIRKYIGMYAEAYCEWML